MNTLKQRNREGGHSAITLMIALVVGMVVAIYLGQSIGYGEWKKVYMAALLLGAVPAFLALGGNYWLVLPFAMTVSLPAIPLVPGRSVSMGELAAVAAVAALAIRLPLSTTRLKWWSSGFLPVVLYVLWAAFIFRVNGAGLAIFGSSTVGARSYLKIGMAFAAFFVVFNQRIEERHCRIIVFSLIASAACSTGWNIYQYLFLQTGEEMLTGGFYSWHQNLSLVPMFFLAFAFAKFSPSDLLRETRVGWIFAIILCYLLAAYSGKRAVFAMCFLMPLLSLAFRRQYLNLGLSLLAAAGLIAGLVGGHGRVFELPLTVQRVLWILPGNWDVEVRMSTLGSFRRTLNQLARRQIEENPIVGRGFGFTTVDAKLASDPHALQKIRQRGDHVGAYIMAVGGQWHSTWLGISATFGIPGAVLWGLIWIQMLRSGWWVVKRSERGSYQHILGMMLLMFTVMDVLTSVTGGHAAGNLWNISWRLAVVLVLRRQIEEELLRLGAEARRIGAQEMIRPGSVLPGRGSNRFGGGPREALARKLR